jgi:hypothetical protein
MTVKQGQEINNKFSYLTDSLKNLNNNLFENKNKYVILKTEKTKIDSILSMTSYKLDLSDKEVKKLNDLIMYRENNHLREKNLWSIWMMFSIVSTLFVLTAK